MRPRILTLLVLCAVSGGCGGEIFLGSNPGADAGSAGTSTSGTSANGTNASGTNASGTNASGTSASGTNANGTSADGGPIEVEEVPQPPVVASCGDSTEELPFTPAAGLDISQAKGYTPDSTIAATAASLLQGASVAELANQMRGTPPLESPDSSVENFADIDRTPDDPGTKIKGFLFRNGTRGVNLAEKTYTSSSVVETGVGYSTAFPVAAGRAAAWDLALEEQIGEDMGDEVLASQNTAIFAPGVDLLRHPAWGRAQESYGEDSFAVGRMGTAFVAGVQQYVPACALHLAAYNIEDNRFDNVSVLDDQTLHEVYGRPFEMVVQDGGVACVMASYNSVQVSDLDDVAYKDTSNPLLLTDTLRSTFGFKGFVVSDYWAMPNYESTGLTPAVYEATAQGALDAGLDIEMPWSLNYATLESFATQAQLLAPATRIVEQKLRFGIATPDASSGLRSPVTSLGPNGITGNAAHIADAEQQAEESLVLLKNDQNTLPIDRAQVHTIAVLGADVSWQLSGIGVTGTLNFATDAPTGDFGSSRVNTDPAITVGPAAGIQAAAGPDVTVLSGTDASLAENADFVVVVAGLTPEDEGEEYTGAGDRASSDGTPNLALDAKSGTTPQNALITAVAAMNKPMAVVLEGGSAIDMPWLASVPAVVMAWYPGQAGGTALGRLLFGDANFSGKLPITWPKSEADEPVFDGGTSTTMSYYVGYRYFDESGISPLFAYGTGLSYTTFKYESLVVPCGTVTKDSVVDVWVSVTNTGTVPGNEVSFLFVSYPATAVRRSVKELKGFHRTPALLQPGQTTTFTIPLRVQDLKYWDTTTNPHGWSVESGPVQIMVGPSSDNLPLQGTMTVQ